MTLAALLLAAAAPSLAAKAVPRVPALAPRVSPVAQLERGILDAVTDRRLTAGTYKNIFLGSAVLGYPLEDSVWLVYGSWSRVQEENRLLYPAGQSWQRPGGVPQFLGVSERAQELVDHWGRAQEQARGLIDGRPLPGPATPEAAARFQALIEQLRAMGDEAAVAYLRGEDPTLTAFLLDARKPGYYEYDGERAMVERIASAPAARAMGVHRLERPDDPGLRPHLYLYRPARVVERLRELSRESRAPDLRQARRDLAPYLKRLGRLRFPAESPPAGEAPPPGRP